MKDFCHKTSAFLKAKINLFAAAFCGASIGFWMLWVARRYYYFSLPWDTPLNVQFIRNLAHGQGGYSSLYGANFLADHCHFYAFLMAPLYRLWPDPLLIRYWEVGVFFAGAYIFFLILKKYLHPFVAFGAMVVFTWTPANVAMLRACFNIEPTAIPLVLLVYKFFDEQKYGPFLVACFLLALVKEQMPLVVMMFGLLALFTKRPGKVKWALVPLLMGLAIFIADVFVITPYFRRDLPVTFDLQWLQYNQFGKTPTRILMHLFTHPWEIYKQMLTSEIVKWYDDLFGIWGGLAFLSPQVLLPALPLFLKSILRHFNLEHNVTGFYFASTFTPFIFLATWHTLNQIQNKSRLYVHTLALGLMLAHALAFIPVWQHTDNFYLNTYASTMERFVNQLPAHASLVADMDYEHDWKELYWLDDYLRGTYTSGRKFVLPDNIDYLLMNSSMQDKENNIFKLMSKPDFYRRWRLKESIEDLALYVKNTSGQAQLKLVDISRVPLGAASLHPVVIDQVMAFKGIDFPDRFPKKYRIFPVVTYWQSLKVTPNVYQMSFAVFLKGKMIFNKITPIGSMVYQTKYWHQGEYVKETYFYLLPHLAPGKYDIILKVNQRLVHKANNIWFDCVTMGPVNWGPFKRSFTVE